jgi:hypothetical protein
MQRDNGFVIKVKDVKEAVKFYNENRGKFRWASGVDQLDIAKLKKLDIALADKADKESLGEEKALELMHILIERTLIAIPDDADIKKIPISEQALSRLEKQMGSFAVLSRQLNAERKLDALFGLIYKNAYNAETVSHCIVEWKQVFNAMALPIGPHLQSMIEQPLNNDILVTIMTRMVALGMQSPDKLELLFKHAGYVCVLFEKIDVETVNGEQILFALQNAEKIAQIETFLRNVKSININPFKRWAFTALPLLNNNAVVIDHLSDIFILIHELSLPLEEVTVDLLCQRANELKTILALMQILKAKALLNQLPDGALNAEDKRIIEHLYHQVLQKPTDAAQLANTFFFNWLHQSEFYTQPIPIVKKAEKGFKSASNSPHSFFDTALAERNVVLGNEEGQKEVQIIEKKTFGT